MSTKTQQEIYEAERNPNQPDNALNPGQDDYNRKFAEMTSRPDMKALDDQADASARDNQSGQHANADYSRRAAAEGEQNVGSTATGKALTAAADASGNVGARLAARAISKLKTRKGGLAGLGALVVIGIFVTAGFLAPSLLLIHLKEEGLSWSTKYTNIGINNRIRLLYSAKIFGDPEACKGPKALCKFYPGMKDNDIQALRDQGFKIDDNDISGKNGKKFIKKMTIDVDGQPVVVTQKNLAKLHATNPKVRVAMNSYINARSLTFRSKESLKKFSIFNVDRSKPLGDKADKKSILTYFREKFYEGKHRLKGIVPGTADGTNLDDRGKAGLENLSNFDEIEAEAEKLRGDNIIEDGPKALVPDTNALRGDNALKSALSIGKTAATGGVKGLFTGWLTGINSSCSIYNTIRVINFGVKALAAARLIQYASLFMTIADKQKVSEISMAEVSFLAGILLKPSRMEASKGKDFSRSQGANLIFYNKVSEPNDLSRFSMGNTASQVLNSLFSALGLSGVSASVCSRVMSWWGQGLLLTFGVISTVLSGGTGAVSGAAAGVAVGLAIGFIQQIMTPRLIPLIAGTMIPDPATDPEGGYGAGNAIAAGLGAFGSQLGRAQGMRPLTTSQFAQLRNSEEYTVMAQADALERQSSGSFNLDNPYSIPNKLAMSIYQLAQPKDSLASYVASAGDTVASAITTPISQSASASVEDEYGGKYCADDDFAAKMGASLEVDLAKDANCNNIYGPDPAILLSAEDVAKDLEANSAEPGIARPVKYGMNDTFYWMADPANGYIDPETGEAKGEYAEYKELCMEGTDPIVDKWSADLSDAKDMSKCYKVDEKYRYFSAYSIHESVLDSMTSISDDRLGVADASTAGSGNVPITPGSMPSGSAQEIAKQLLQYTADGTISCNLQARDCPDITKTANDTPIGGNCVGDALDARVVGSLLVLAQKGYKLVLSSLCSDHDNDGLQHPKGKAFDINFINGVWIGGGSDTGYWGPSTPWGPLTEKVTKEIVSFAPKDEVGIGQIQCHPTWPFLSGINTFNDACHHIHVSFR